MTDEELSRIEATAKAVVKICGYNTWMDGDGVAHAFGIWSDGQHVCDIADDHPTGYVIAKYIAEVDPCTILEMVDEIRMLSEEYSKGYRDGFEGGGDI